MLGFQAGLTALRASQVGINVTAQNLANAGTEGYHRRDVIFSERVLHASDRGYGVDIDAIRRIRSTVTESLLTNNISSSAYAGAQLDTLEQIETLMTPGDGSIHDRLQLFFASLQELSSRSDDTALQRLVIERGSQLAAQINAISNEVNRIRNGLDRQIQSAVDDVNDLSIELTDLHRRLFDEKKDTQPANAIRDRYDKLVNQLAEYVDVQPDLLRENHGIVRFASGGGIIGQVAAPLEFTLKDGMAAIRRVGEDDALNFSGGNIGGLLSARNDLLQGFGDELEQFTTDLITAIDSVHATGVGQNGAFEILTGSRNVSDLDAPLSAAEIKFPITGGSLYVRITDVATGEARLEKIEIDPTVDSLRSVAAKLDAISNLETVLSEDSGRLTVAAAPGYEFDFTGRLETSPDPSGIAGTSRPTLSGAYSGDDNDTLTFQVSATGTVGLTPDLFVDVLDGSGNLVRRLNVGDTYEPGSDIEVVDGVSIAFTSGTLVAGDTTTTEIVADADTSGLLVALGVNSFFDGFNANSIGVNPDLLNDPTRFAGSLTGDASDSRNLNRMLGMRDQLVALDGNRTLEQAMSELTAFIGNEVASTRLVLEGLTLTGEQLEAQRESVSGVDPNEELVKMLNYQKSFQAASRLISAINETFDELLRIF